MNRWKQVQNTDQYSSLIDNKIVKASHQASMQTFLCPVGLFFNYFLIYLSQAIKRSLNTTSFLLTESQKTATPPAEAHQPPPLLTFDPLT